MGKKKGFTRAKKNRWRSKNTTEAQANHINPPDPPKNRLTEDKRKDPPHPTLLPKEPNPSINLDSGSNVGLDFNASSVDDCCNLDLGSNVVPQFNEQNNEEWVNCNKE